MCKSTITYDVSDHIATITLDVPERLNAFGPAMSTELIDAFDQVDADDDVRVVIVTGAGERAFVRALILAGARTRSVSSLKEMRRCSATLAAASRCACLNAASPLSGPSTALRSASAPPCSW